MKKIFFLLLFVTPIVMFGQTSVQTAVTSFANYWAFKNAGVTVTVRDLADGSIIASHNSDLALPPASIAKLFSTASAFEILGEKYTPKTELYTDGKINASGALEGNLYLRALGDPTLGSKYFNDDGAEDQYLKGWVQDMKLAGIKEITGKVIVDGSAFGYQGCPEGWTWGDMGNYYGAGPSAVIINDNILQYYFKTSNIGKPSTLVRTVPEIDGLRLLNNIKGQNVSGDNSLIYGAPYSLDLYASGSLPYNRSSFMVKGTVPDPERLLSKKLYDAIMANGIKVSDGYEYGRNLQMTNTDLKPYSSMTLIKSWEGKTIEEIAFHTNMRSVNIFAEQLVCLIGYEKKGEGSTSNGLDFITDYWKEKLDLKHLYLHDGSGLSRTNAISSNQFTLLLKYMAGSEKYDVFKSTLPTAGQSGTLRKVCKGQAADGRVFAKSGTMNRIKSYAGYVKSKSGKELCFSMTVNNYDCSNSVTVDQMEKLFNAMANY